MPRYSDIDPQDIDPDTGAPYPGYSSPALDTSFHDHEMDVDDVVCDDPMVEALAQELDKPVSAIRTALENLQKRGLVQWAHFDPPDDGGEPSCTNPAGHKWAYTGTQYGGDDERWQGEGRCYCEHCGADGDA